MIPIFRNLLFAFVFFLVTGAAEASGGGSRQPSNVEAITKQPMVFFVAKGGLNSCGPGCSEWIAAEGSFDPQAHARLRAFLASQSDNRLPIFFHSKGGFVEAAQLVGRTLREKRMTAGVGQTIAEKCGGGSRTASACRNQHVRKAQLRFNGAVCASACVYAFLGASVRNVAPGTRVGVHGSRLVSMQQEDQAAKLARYDKLYDELKSYAVEMGVDAALIDAAKKTSPQHMHWLSRREIAGFGIESLAFYETPWTSHKNSSGRHIVLKSVTLNREQGDRGYQTSLIRLSCLAGASAINVGYERDLAPDDERIGDFVRLVAGEREFVLRRPQARAWGNIQTSGGDEYRKQQAFLDRFVINLGEAKPENEQRSEIMNWEFLRHAITIPHIEVAEERARDGPATFKLSTNGLSKAQEGLHSECGEGRFLSPQYRRDQREKPANSSR